MYELETLVVPVELGVWLEDMKIGQSSHYFTMIDALNHYWETIIGSETGGFIFKYKKELIEVIIGTRRYRVEKEPKYYAMIKGHELMTDEGIWDCRYWNLSTSDGVVFPSDRFSQDSRFLTKMSKEDWSKCGINDSNADFVKMEEVER